MFMVAILGVLILFGAVIALVVVRKNHSSRAGKSGMAAVNKQTFRNTGQGKSRAHTGAD